MKPKRKLRNRKKVVQKPLPIMIVPDKSYMDDTGAIIPSDVILISDPTIYKRMKAILDSWGKEPMGVPGKRGDLEG